MAGKIKSNGTGLTIEFSNGIALSIQVGPGTYSGNHRLLDMGLFEAQSKITKDLPESHTAEIALLKDGQFITKQYENEGDDVLGYKGPDEILSALIWAAAQKD